MSGGWHWRRCRRSPSAGGHSARAERVFASHPQGPNGRPRKRSAVRRPPLSRSRSRPSGRKRVLADIAGLPDLPGRDDGTRSTPSLLGRRGRREMPNSPRASSTTISPATGSWVTSTPLLTSSRLITWSMIPTAISSRVWAFRRAVLITANSSTSRSCCRRSVISREIMMNRGSAAA